MSRFQDPLNIKDCNNCIHNTRYSQINYYSIVRRNICHSCDMAEHVETFVPSEWEEIPEEYRQ